MTRQEFFEMKAAGALWDVGVSINRTNPLPLDKNAVFASYDEALTYAQGVLSYPGQFIAVVAEDGSVTGYMITVAGGSGATMQKLAAQTSTGDVVADLAALTTRVGNLETSVDGIKTEIGAKAADETAATGIYKYVDDKVAAATPDGYAGVKADVTKLVGAASVEGSVAEKIQTAITGLDLANTYAAKSHTHAMEQVTGLADEFAKYQKKGDYALKSEVTAVEQKANDLATLVGTLPEGAKATTVVEYAKEVADAATGNAATVGAKVDTLIGDDADKSVRTIANEELAKQLIPANAQESLDTLKEIADWIQAHPAEVTEMNSKITALEGKAHEHTNKAVLDGITAEKVTSWDSALHDGDIPAATAEALGLVKVDNTSIESNKGVIGIKAVNVQKLFVAEGDEFILDGGNA